MTLFSAILIILIFYLFINILLIDKLNNKTKYIKNKSIIKTSYVLIFIFFGIFCLLFLNKIREKRKIEYFKMALDYYHIWYDSNVIVLSHSEYAEKVAMERYLKLKNIKIKK